MGCDIFDEAWFTVTVAEPLRIQGHVSIEISSFHVYGFPEERKKIVLSLQREFPYW